MKKIYSYLALIVTTLFLSIGGVWADGYTIDYQELNVDTKDAGAGSALRSESSGFASGLRKALFGGEAVNQPLILGADKSFSTTGDIKTAGVNIVKGIKNIVIILASTILLIMVIRLLGASGTEEEVKKLKSSVVAIALGIFIMQSAYVFVNFFLEKNAVNASTAMSINEGILLPLTNFLIVFSQIAFLFMAAWAALRITTALGRDEKIKAAKTMLVSAIIGFFLLQIPKLLVRIFYGEVTVSNTALNDAGGGSMVVAKITTKPLSEIGSAIASILDYVNSFLALAILLMIIYAGSLIALGAGQEESVKKAKSMITYIVIGCILLMGSFLFLRLVLSGVIFSS